MILAIDVHYKEQYAKIVGVVFEWDDMSPRDIYSTMLTGVAPYVAGKIIDGHCYVNNEGDHGLGGYLWTAIDMSIPIIGLAKNRLDGNDEYSFPVYRGNSKKPLFISTIGIDQNLAIERIVEMKEGYRIPTVLKELDRVTKEK